MARILVIDDDASIREDVARFLGRAGHQVAVAQDGKEALRLFEAEPAELVITDIYMPEMDGYEVIRTFRKLRPGIPVVAMSAGGQFPKETLLETAGYLGAIESIPKPFDLDELLSAVERALGGGAEEDGSSA